MTTRPVSIVATADVVDDVTGRTFARGGKFSVPAAEAERLARQHAAIHIVPDADGRADRMMRDFGIHRG